MTKIEKYITIAFITTILFLLSILLYNNDLINYSIIFMTLTVISFFYLIHTVLKKDDELSKYKYQLKKILNTYDSIIIHVNKNVDFLSSNIIFVKSFKDLFVAYLELNKLIMYFKEDESSIFLLQNNNELYVYVLKINENINSNYENYLKGKIGSKLFLVNNN